jgi:hypothetical protein
MKRDSAWDASRVPDVLIGCSRLIRELIVEREQLKKQVKALREELLSCKEHR